jgi:hypothetical protein
MSVDIDYILERQKEYTVRVVLADGSHVDEPLWATTLEWAYKFFDDMFLALSLTGRLSVNAHRVEGMENWVEQYENVQALQLIDWQSGKVITTYKVGV